MIVAVRVDLISEGGLQELDEAAVAARIAAGDTALLREARALDGAIADDEAWSGHAAGR